MITKITIENFRSINHLEWNAGEKINLLMGKNGAGKSSFLSAVRFALTGDIDKADICEKDLCASVYVELDDGSNFSRTVYADSKPSKVVVNGKNATAKVLAEKLEMHFGVSPADMKFISASNIGALKPTEFAEFIGKFLPDKITSESVLKAASEMTASQKEFLASILPNEFTLGEMDEIYDEAFNCRKLRKQELATTQAKATFDRVLPTMTAEAIDARLGEIAFFKKQKEKVLMANAEYQNAIKRFDTYNKELSDLKAQISSISVTKPSPKIEEVAMTDIANATKVRAEASSTISVLQKNVDTLSKVLDNLSSNHCPLSDKVVCTTDKSVAKSEIEITINENNKSIKVLNEKCNEASESIEKANQRLVAFKEQSNEYNKKSALLIKLGTMEANKPNPPVKPTMVVEAFDETEEAKLQEAKKTLALYEQSRKAQKRVETLEQEVSDIDVVVKELSLKGSVRAKVVYDYLAFFEDEINTIAKGIGPEMEFHFSVENGITPNFKTKASAYARKYEYLSRGEQVICDLILLLFCSKFTGTGIIFLDNFNDLDVDNMKYVVNSIKGLGDEYTVFVAAVETTEINDIFGTIPHTRII